MSFDWFTNYFQEEHSNRKDKKQDFTPQGVTDLASKLLGKSESNADICAGTGGLTIKRWLDNRDAEFYCEEYSDRAMPFLLFNLMIRNVGAVVVHGDVLTQKHKNIYKLVSGDCFSELEELDSLPKFIADNVIMNPPYSLPWNPQEKMKTGLFGEIGVLPPKAKADYAFLIRGLERLSDSGTQLLILPHGVLFRGNAEGKIRQWLIEHNYLDTVIGLPGKVFLNTDIPTAILILKKKRDRRDVLFIDASKQSRKDKAHNVDEFMAKYATGINIKENEIGKFPIQLHNKETQDAIAKMFGYVESQEQIVQDEINNLKNLKGNMMDKMFV